MNTSVGAFQKTFTLETKEQIEKPAGVPGSDNPQMNSVVIQALAANTGIVYIGGSDVDSTHGFPLAAGASVAMDTSSLGGLYGFALKATDKVAVLYVGP